MDRLIYVAATGATQTLAQQATVAHNLANVGTTGFRAEYNMFRAVPVVGQGAPTRAFAIDTTVGANFATGAIQQTGRDLDVAVQGSGWIAVQGADGREAYTRNGNLQLSPNGVLQTREGRPVMGEGGPLSIPPDTNVTIAKDGTISAAQSGTRPNTVVTVGRIKLVDPPPAQLVKGSDGLFRLSSGADAQSDPAVTLASGALEGSNVNVVEAMVAMIALARQFDMQMKMLQNADSNERQAGQILNMNR
ncbi:MAG TPA: flagellar basal-body rod protein FlgF [Burkholderiales bacterium]|nr:flagellar basal-body rod protein FlgF [Burkholderiales bacterium]